MTFLELLDGAEVLFQRGNPVVSGLQYDSRSIRPGDVFLAIRGETTDGNRYIEKAITAGAVAVVTDSPTEQPRAEVAWAQMPHGRRAMGRLSANFFRKPAQRLAITGVTGTNGKTTATFLLESILRAAGRKCALVGTIEYHVADEVLPAPHTTPESLDLNQLFARALAAGVTETAMEVSSHALAQQRVFGIPFDVAVFTNLTRDHLDFHRDMEDYFAAKRVLFQGCGTDAPRVSVLNLEDEFGRRLVKDIRSAETLTYGLERGEFRAERAEIGASGTRFDIVTGGISIPVFSPLIGRVNVYNILAAAAAGTARGCSPEDIARGVEALERVPGRFERVSVGQPFAVVVDYAHTDDALRNLTSLAREFVNAQGRRGRVITVFGCGGDRDRAKRPLMGEAAGKGSDLVIVTSDNPRSEDPLTIIQDAVVGLQRTTTRYTVESDRRLAIALAVGEARAGDIVLIAGKGHEKVQVTRQGAFPFDDVEVAREALRAAGHAAVGAAREGGA